MKALFVIDKKDSNKVSIDNSHTLEFGGKIYIAVEDGPRISGAPIKEVAQKLHTTFSMA